MTATSPDSSVLVVGFLLIAIALLIVVGLSYFIIRRIQEQSSRSRLFIMLPLGIAMILFGIDNLTAASTDRKLGGLLFSIAGMAGLIFVGIAAITRRKAH